MRKVARYCFPVLLLFSVTLFVFPRNWLHDCHVSHAEGTGDHLSQDCQICACTFHLPKPATRYELISCGVVRKEITFILAEATHPEFRSFFPYRGPPIA